MCCIPSPRLHIACDHGFFLMSSRSFIAFRPLNGTQRLTRPIRVSCYNRSSPHEEATPKKKEMQALLSHLKKLSQYRQLLTRVCCSLWIVQRAAFYLFIPYYQCVKYSHLPWPLYRQFRLTGATSLKNGSEENKRQSSSTSTKYAVALASYRELHSTYLSHITNESGIPSCLDHSMESLGWQGLTGANRG